MEKISQYIHEQLQKHGINKNFQIEIEENWKIKQLPIDMPLIAAYNSFLMGNTNKFPIFQSILKNSYLYDISFKINSDIEKVEKELKKALKDRIEYIYTEENENNNFIGIKLNENAFNSVKNLNIPSYLVPYHLIKSCDSCKTAKFNEKLFEYKTIPGVSKKFAEFIEHLKSCNLPLSIVDYDLLFENTGVTPFYDAYVYLEESSQWPNEIEAINCAKTAFYCQLYTKSSYSVFIDKKFVVFKYKNIYFKVKILIKRDFSVKYKIKTELISTVKKQGELLHRKSRIAKTILAKLGFYPILIDDFLVDCICLIIGKDTVGDAKFIEEFLNFSFDLDNKRFLLDSLKLEQFAIKEMKKDIKQFKVCFKDITYNCILPKQPVIDNLKRIFKKITEADNDIFDENNMLITNSLLEPDISEYDIILSKEFFDDFRKIENGKAYEFLLGTPSIEDFLSKFGSPNIFFYYSPLNEMLMIKCSDLSNIDLFINSLVTQTSFSYIKINYQ